MNNKALVIGAIVAVALAAGAWGVIINGNVAYFNNQNNNQNQDSQHGTLYMSITDDGINMGNVSAVTMTVDKVYIHSQAQGWVDVSYSSPQTFSLLELKASEKSKLMAKAVVFADTYDQVWFHVANVAVTESGQVKTAAMPSNDVKMNVAVKVMGNTDSTADVDIMADQSLHKDANGQFIFAPVVKFESRSNASVNIDANNLLTISGGSIDSSVNSGMDANGEVKANFKLDSEQKLEIKNNIINKVNIDSQSEPSPGPCATETDGSVAVGVGC